MCSSLSFELYCLDVNCGSERAIFYLKLFSRILNTFSLISIIVKEHVIEIIEIEC